MNSTATVKRALVTGAGGFIGHHLTKRLKANGFWVRGVDIKRPEFEPTAADEFVVADLRELKSCMEAVRGVDDVYQLAADMGGIGYISTNHASLSRNNALINAHMLESARVSDVARYFYSSSACVYPAHLQEASDFRPLKEGDAIPANPEKGYGWEKLFAEQLTSYFGEEYGLGVRIARFHNIYGPLGTFEGGREKAPAAICRKVAESPEKGEIRVWGDGQQTRSFCFIDDCVEGVRRIMESNETSPLNLGTSELVTVDELVDMVCTTAGKPLSRVHEADGPQGVRGRNSDNTNLRAAIGWEPTTPLRVGLSITYNWIWSQLHRLGRAQPPVPVPVGEASVAPAGLLATTASSVPNLAVGAPTARGRS
jgi:GDP-D-mannose 3',5'-epimerase